MAECQLWMEHRDDGDCVRCGRYERYGRTPDWFVHDPMLLEFEHAYEGPPGKCSQRKKDLIHSVHEFVAGAAS